MACSDRWRGARAVTLALAILAVGDASCRPSSGARPVEAPRPPLAAGTEAIPQDLQGCSLNTQAKTSLDGLSLEAIVAFRRARVARHARLHIFPEGYDPLAPTSARIWRPIAPGAKWLGPTPYYVANPYVLIVAVCANRVTPLNLRCPEVAITYSNRRLVELRGGDAARCWLRYVHERPYTDEPGSVRLVMVNAFDAGYRHAHLDRARSTNVLDEASPTSVVNGVFSQPSLFHLGKYGANNISPKDRNGWVRLARPQARTLLTVKLWRLPPQSLRADADLEYVIDLDPAAAGPRP